MRVLKGSILLSAAVFLTACGNDDKKADRAAYEDMMLPRPAAQQVISPEELGLVEPVTVAQPLAPQPAAKPAATTTTARRSTSSTARRSTSTSSGSGTYTPARQPVMVTKKNTKRDAAIGAAAGATIGAVVNGNNRVKGAVIGGVLGGVAGAVIGNNVDVKKVPQY